VNTSEVTSYKLLCASQPGRQVRGLVLLDRTLYVVRKNSAQIDALHPTTLASLKTLALPASTDPCNMAACQAQKALYITCYVKKELLKVNVPGPPHLSHVLTTAGSFCWAIRPMRILAHLCHPRKCAL